MTTKVHYFDGYGRAEPIRMLLVYCKIDFENINYTDETLPIAKASGNLEFGQLPVLEVEGKFFSQSGAILRLLGAKHGFYPEDPYTAWKIDSIIDSVGDLYNGYFKAAEAPEDQKETLLKAYYENFYTMWLDAIQNRIKMNSSQKYIVGDKITIADFQLASIAYASFLNESSASRDTTLAIVERYPLFFQYAKGLGEELKDYISARKPSPW